MTGNQNETGGLMIFDRQANLKCQYGNGHFCAGKAFVKMAGDDRTCKGRTEPSTEKKTGTFLYA